jgi:WD40 repeat protein
MIHAFSHSDVVTDLAFSADGQVLASTSRDRTVKLWDVSSGKAINTLEGNFRTVINISSDNQFLVTGDENGQIQIWQVVE